MYVFNDAGFKGFAGGARFGDGAIFSGGPCSCSSVRVEHQAGPGLRQATCLDHLLVLSIIDIRYA